VEPAGLPSVPVASLPTPAAAKGKLTVIQWLPNLLSLSLVVGHVEMEEINVTFRAPSDT